MKTRIVQHRLGITTADQIAVLFNAVELLGNSINLTDLALKFFSSTGTFLGAIDSQYNFENRFASNGITGFTFVVDAVQQFLIYKIGSEGPVLPASIAEPGTVALLGLGLFGFAASRRKLADNKNR